MAQATGKKGSLLIDFESSFAETPDPKKVFDVPFKTDNFQVSEGSSADDTMRGRRDAAEPDSEAREASGQVVYPVDAHNTGLHLRALFGLPVSTVVAAVPLDDGGSASVVAGGKVKIPAAAHGLAAGASVIISGTTHYDGSHVLQKETDADNLVIASSFTAESFSDTDTVQLGLLLTLDADDAVNVAAGRSGLPCTGHGLPVGAEVTIADSTSYDGTFIVLRETTANLIVVAKAYTAKTFSGSETVTTLFYDHVYKVQDEVPSFHREKQFPVIPAYYLGYGVKAGSWGLTLSSSGQLSMSIDYMAANEVPGTMSYAHEQVVVSLPYVPFKSKNAVVMHEGLVVSRRFQELSINYANDLDDDTLCIGPENERGGLGAGDATATGTLRALFTNMTFLDLANAGTKTSLTGRLTNGGYMLDVTMNELKFDPTSPPKDTPKGIKENLNWSAFYQNHAADSIIVVTLRNDIKSWEE